MIQRHHDSARLGRRTAYYSECERYRYALSIDWAGGPTLTCCGLNPSTATEKDDDRTIAKMVRLSKKWGYGSLIMVNLFAFRATKPADMLKASDPVGPSNGIGFLFSMTENMFLCAWGVQGTYQDRNRTVLAGMRAHGLRLGYLKLTKDGHPQHPLYLPETDLVITDWD